MSTSKTAPKKKTSKTEAEGPKSLNVSKAVLTPEFLENQMDFLDEEDLLLCYDIRVMNSEGQVYQIKGNSSFPHAINPQRLKVIPQQFQNVVADSLLNPLLEKFNDFINTHTTNVQPLPPAGPSGFLEDSSPSPGTMPYAQEEDVTKDPSPDPSSMS